MKQIKQETGRSMVEMLGVLAVIGVLSVGGIAAYKNAMNRHEANSIRNEVNRRVVVWASDNAFGRGYSPFNKTALGYQWQEPEDKGDFIQFGVSGIEAEICEKVKSNDWKMVYVNDTCTTFAFKNDLTQFVPQKTCSDCNSQCGVCDTLTGKCVPNNNRCSPGKPYCGANGICTECENGYYLDSSETTPTCKLCSFGGSTIVPKNECYNCSDRFVNYKGQCMHCDRVEAANPYVSDAADCLRCPNRIFVKEEKWNGETVPEGAIGTCYYCDPTYGEQSPNRDKCEMKQSQTCQAGEYFRLGTCGECSSNDGQDATSRDYCLSCKGSRYYSSGWGRCVDTSEYTLGNHRRNGTGVVKEDCLAMEGVPLYFYGEDENDGICEWCPTAIVTDANGEKVCADTCPTGTYLYLEHKKIGQNSCCPNNATCAGRKTKCNAGYYLNAAGTACDACPEGTTSKAGATSVADCT